MAPKQKKRGSQSARGGRSDIVHVPLAYHGVAGSSEVTIIKHIHDLVGMNRVFRISGYTGELSAAKYPTMVQFKAYGPAGAGDNLWCSRLQLIPTGTVRRVRNRIPATSTGWFTSNVSDPTVVFEVMIDCVDKAQVGVVSGFVYLTVLLRPLEVSAACPTRMISLPSTSARSVVDGKPDEEYVRVLSSDSDQLYFST